MVIYRTFKVKGSPTPNDKLIICDTCHKADWCTHSTGRQYYCCSRRMREATAEEYVEGKAAVKKIIG